MLRHLAHLLDGASPDRPVTVLDVATGGADIPRAVAAWARRAGRTIRLVAADRHAQVLGFARRSTPATDCISFVRHDALAAPFPAAAFDVVTCSLTLHHFDEDGAVALLRDLDRLARLGVVVNDLRRGWLAYLGARALVAPLGARHCLTRHDAPLSVLRAYTPAELRGLADRAGLSGARLFLHRPFRMALVVEKPQHA